MCTFPKTFWFKLLEAACFVQLCCKFSSAFLAMGKSFQQVDATERRLIKQMAKEGIPWTTSQRITKRSPDFIFLGRLLAAWGQ